jgi:tRNA (guanine-N7-)-methyltransferase
MVTSSENAETGPGVDAERPMRRVTSFHSQRGRLTVSQAGALERLWPRYGFEIDGASALDLGEMFGGRPVVVEIGFGMGDATAEMAAADPSTGILAVDVHTPGQGSLLAKIEERSLENVRIASGDAVRLLKGMVGDGSLAGVRIFFPDPWPKKRHHKRRLVRAEFVRVVVERLAVGGVLHCATDWEPYAEEMLGVLGAETGLRNLASGGVGFAERPGWRPVTKFERQGVAKGHAVRDLLFEKSR